ncbi:MAG: preprotein translocase subunit SecE [Actinobacteria bacterium]|nr:preprotein translocase subunit SecE [Actinomycetota bacterium]
MSEDSAELETDTSAELRSSDSSKVRSGDGGGRRSAKAVAGHGFFERTAQFLRDTRAEMRRVSWPNATVVKNTTIITLIAVIFFSLYLFAVDRVWAFLIDHLRSWLGG